MSLVSCVYPHPAGMCRWGWVQMMTTWEYELSLPASLSPPHPISSSSPFSPPVPVGRVFHRHLPHQCPRDARPICGAWIAGGPWAGWSTGSTAEVTTELASSHPQLPPLSLTNTCSRGLPCGLLTQIYKPDFSFLLQLGGQGWGEVGYGVCLGIGMTLG